MVFETATVIFYDDYYDWEIEGDIVGPETDFVVGITTTDDPIEFDYCLN